MQNANQMFEFWDRTALHMAEEAIEAQRYGDHDAAKIWRQGRDMAMENADHWHRAIIGGK
jgi:hypothetical protein